MYAILRELHYDEKKLSGAAAALEEFRRLHAAQPGFRGTLSVDLGKGRRFIVNLWDTEVQAMEGRKALVPAVRRLLEPLLASPAQFVEAGPVVEYELRDGP